MRSATRGPAVVSTRPVSGVTVLADFDSVLVVAIGAAALLLVLIVPRADVSLWDVCRKYPHQPISITARRSVEVMATDHPDGRTGTRSPTTVELWMPM
jgi:hypothetical protein